MQRLVITEQRCSFLGIALCMSEKGMHTVIQRQFRFLYIEKKNKKMGIPIIISPNP